MNKRSALLSIIHLANRNFNKSFHKTSTFVSSNLVKSLHYKQDAIWSSKCFLRLYSSISEKPITHTTTPQSDSTNVIDREDETLSLETRINSVESDSLDQLQESPNIKIITDGDLSLEKKLKVLFLEVEVYRQEGRRVPSSLQNEQWKEILHMTSRTARRKYLTYLWGIEMKKQSEKRKKEEKRLEREQRYASDTVEDDGTVQYGLNRNSIVMRVYDTTINQLYNNKLVQAIQFGQKIVVDCGYDQHMTSRESVNAAKQITYLFSENRNHHDPFNLYLCNANRNGNTLTQLCRFINTLYEDHFPVNVSEKSYLELFPKENLVYLTPHCREELSTFDHNAVYIIGAMVDKINTEPLSLAKAKKEGLRMAKLPLERYLNWGSGGGKSLTLNQMMLIMLELKTSGDWDKALVHVPKRKLNFDEQPGSQYMARHRTDGGSLYRNTARFGNLRNKRSFQDDDRTSYQPRSRSSSSHEDDVFVRKFKLK